MKVAVGSKNQQKIAGVRDAFLYYYPADDLVVESADIHIDEFGHPKNLNETVEGAIRRAQAAFGDCEFSVGLESGLIEVPHTQTGYMEGMVCAVYDGKNVYLGLSPCLEWPASVIYRIVKKGLDGSQAFRDAGLTDHPKIGEGEGAISIFTKGVIDRRKQIELAVITALVHVLNPEYYSG